MSESITQGKEGRPMASTGSDLTRRALLQRAAAGAALAASSQFPLVRPASAQGEPVSLEFWTPASSPATSGLIVDMVNQFNSTVGKEHGVTVNARIKPVTNDDYVPYTTAMTSSGSPDVVMTFIYSPVVSWAVNGFIQPLDDYAQAAGIKESDFFPIAWTMSNFGGHIWGLLQEFDFNQLWWNTDIHQGEAPKTFDELDALATQYTLFDDAGNLTQAGIVPWIAGSEWNALWGGSFYDVDARKWTINTPENRKFLDWFLKWVDLLGGRDKSDALDSSIPREYGGIFLYGKIAFSLEGEYLLSNLVKQGIELNYKIAHPPTAPEVPYGTAVTSGGNLFLLPTKAPHPAEAALFIQYMGGLDAVLAWCVPSANIPPVKAAAAAPEFTEPWPELKPWLESLDLGHMVPPNPSPQLPLFDQLMSTAIDEVTYKSKTPEQALDDVAQKIADAVSQFQQTHPEWEGE
jgi:ABC-type glycerol-3-phosphate transport system substrate-binding protein